MNYILWCASKDLGIFFTFFYCTEKNVRQIFAAQKISWAGILGSHQSLSSSKYFQCILIFFQESVTTFQLNKREKIVCDFCPVFSEKKFCPTRYPLGYRLVIKELISYFPFFMHLIQRKPLKILISYILRPDENSLHFCPCKHRISLLQVQVVAVPEHSHNLQITGLAWMWVISW